MQHIVIIGNGIAGITAARHIRKLSDNKITVISGESDYFFSRTALMYIYMGHMKYEHTKPYEDWFWEKNRIELKNAWVSKVSPEENKLTFANGETMHYDQLIIASGSKYNKFGWPGQDLNGVQGLITKQDVELLENNAPNNEVCKRAVVVGGGLIGIELCEMFRSREIPVTFLVKDAGFWNNILPKEESEIANRHIREHHVDLRLNSNLREILPGENGKVGSVVIDETGEKINCNVVCLSAGVSPNVEFLKDSGIELGKGIKVNRYLQTNIENIYAIGDCAEQRQPLDNRKAIEQVWYTGRMMGETVAQTICGNKMPYNPGNWFNSAKFFDIEYQTYGWIYPEPEEGTRHFYWEHPDGKKSIRLGYDTNSRKLLGVINLGIRLRHEVIDNWLTQGKLIEEVVNELQKANFDPEFYRRYEDDIQIKFNEEMSILN
jgi:NADH oxidase (H2O2-forming)